MSVIVDSCVWRDYYAPPTSREGLERIRPWNEALDRLLDAESARISVINLIELEGLFGSGRSRFMLNSILGSCREPIPIVRDDVALAVRLTRKMRSAVPPKRAGAADLLIAAAAIRRGMRILSCDHHFYDIRDSGSNALKLEVPHRP